METKKIQAVITSANVTANVSGGQINTTIGEVARMETQQAVHYIKAGTDEIASAVAAGKAELDNEGQQYVDLAKDWATKTSGTVDGTDYSAKYYAQSILPIASEITTVAGIASDVAAVGGIASDVSSVAANNADISTVADNLTNIDTVAGIAGDISTVAGVSAGVTAVAGNATNINAVASDIASINAVAADLTNIDNASTYAAEAKQYAIGDPTEPAEGSAKYWAEQASHSVPNDGQLDIQVNGSSIATFTANQSGNTTANIVVGSGLPSQTGNAGKVLGTDGTDASWQYSIKDEGYYSSSTQYYPGDIVKYYYDGVIRSYLCKQSVKNSSPFNEASSYWMPFDAPSQIRVQNDWGDKPILPFIMNGSSGSTITGVMLTPGTTSTINNFPTINTSTGLLKAPAGIDGYYTSAQVDALIPTVNNSAITFTQGGVTKGSFTLNQSSGATIALDAGGAGGIDGVTIDTNSDDELEAIGVIDNNGNAIKTWTGTLAQYNAIATKDPNTLYNITDDMSIPQTILETLYPVGSLYIGKMSTCPLASLIPNSTWTLVASDKVLQGSGTHTAGTSVNAGLPNITGTLERVVTCTSGGSGTAVSKGSGVFSGTPSVAVNKTAPGSGNWWNDTRDLSFKASNSNSIYGKSTTVQPPAYVVNIWERTA